MYSFCLPYKYFLLKCYVKEANQIEIKNKKANDIDLRNIYYGYTQEEILENLGNQSTYNEINNKKLKIPKFCNNRVSTSKYNYLTFLPKSILIQFLRIYNFYFLAIVVFQGIPAISTSPVYLAALPFVFVIGISVIRELYEEIKRRRNDKTVNSLKAMVLRDSKFHETTWAQLKVGDIVFVEEDETFPADLLLLQCSNHFGNAYIQTTTLDGERALKSRQAFTEILENMKDQKVGLGNLKMHLKCEKPNSSIYQFEGKLKMDSPKMNDIKVTYSQFLLRGAVLANTDWIIGMVVYAGHDTKLMKNMGKVKYKQTHIEKTLNKIVIFLVIFQIILCLTVAIQAAAYNRQNTIVDNNQTLKGNVYLFRNQKDSETSIPLDTLTSFMKFFLLLSSIIPISLLVSLEIIKVIQSISIFYDAQMYSVQNDQGCKVMSISLHEELGLITDVFTDKTGTLTSNEMVFQACSVGMVRYDAKKIESYERSNDLSREDSCDEPRSADDPLDTSDPGSKVLRYLHSAIIKDINDYKNYNEYKFGNFTLASQVDFLKHFWLGVCLCHEVISISKAKQKIVKQHYEDMLIDHEDNRSHQSSHKNEENDNSENLENDNFSVSEQEIDENEELVYHGMSPDEITLVNSAKKVGFEFRYRSNRKIEVKIMGETKIFNLLKIFPFTSERKRMTVIVQDPDDPEYVISFTKGADNVMKSLSLEDFSGHFNFSCIDKFAKKGYRTLLVGMKVIRFSEFVEWEQVFNEVNKEVGISDQGNKELEELVSLIERDLFLLGTTALEDKLQENVHECIEEFRRADIKVWMITGDKLETAENIGISCRLLQEDADRFVLTEKNEDKAVKVAKNVYKYMKKKLRANNKSVNCDLSDDKEDIDCVSGQDIQAQEAQAKSVEQNLSKDSIRYTVSTNKKKEKKSVFEENLFGSDAQSLSKKLKIGEKKSLVKQILYNSSLNTSLKFSKSKAIEQSDLNFEVVIEGECLAIMLKEENRKLFANIINRSHAVLVCRSSPKQKAEVIEFAKSINPKMISLAIGDGGNDVSMIKTADVGIGIFGKEGYQAVNASDYAIAEFQYLRRLMFIHGRYCARRMTIFMTQFLIKNLLLSMCQYIFAYYSAYSGQTLFEPGYVTVFNLISSQITICYLAIYDQDVSPDTKNRQRQLLMPYLYAETRDHSVLGYKGFLAWYLYALYSCFVVYYITYYSYYDSINSNGFAFGMWQMSFTCYFCICSINFSIVALHIQAWNYVAIFFNVLHVLLFYPGWVLLYNEWPYSNIYKNQLDFYSYGLFWLTCLLIVCAVMLPISFIKQGKSLFYPKLIDLVLGNRIGENEEIEEKLRIDMIKINDDHSLESYCNQKIMNKSMGAETHQNLEQVDSEKELSSCYEESKKEYSKSENNEEVQSLENSIVSQNLKENATGLNMLDFQKIEGCHKKSKSIFPSIKCVEKVKNYNISTLQTINPILLSDIQESSLRQSTLENHDYDYQDKITDRELKFKTKKINEPIEEQNSNSKSQNESN